MGLAPPQGVAQLPPMHSWPPVQTWPQLPQLFESTSSAAR
jgi:hypothetical protein